jgi:hypothetical protein
MKDRAETAFDKAKKEYIEALDAGHWTVENLTQILLDKVTLDPRTGLDEEQVVAAVATSVVAYFEAQRDREYEDREGYYIAGARFTHHDWGSMTGVLKLPASRYGEVEVGVYNPKDKSGSGFTYNRRNRVSVQRYDRMMKDELSEVESFCVEARTPITVPEKLCKELIHLIGREVRILPWRVMADQLPASAISFVRPESEKRTPRSRALVQADRRSHIKDNLRVSRWRIKGHSYAEDPMETLEKADYHLKLYKGPQAAEALAQTAQLREDYAEATAKIQRILSELESKYVRLEAFVSSMK